MNKKNNRRSQIGSSGIAGSMPAAGALEGQQAVSGYEGRQLVNIFIGHGNGTGTIASPGFTIMSDYIV